MPIIRHPEFDAAQLKTISINDRLSKVSVGNFAYPPRINSTFKQFADSLPDILMGKNIKLAANVIVEAVKNNKPVIFALGGHVIKTGLSPVINQLIRKKIITCIVMSGATAIHDVEVGLFGETSEDVAPGLIDGTFGMTEETQFFINSYIKEASNKKVGLGQHIGCKLSFHTDDYWRYSILATAFNYNIPATIHIALGTDVIHMHKDADGAAIGDTSIRDFRILTEYMRNLPGGGVIVNIGSAIILPEVFLKSIASLRNVMGKDFTNFTSINMDFIQGYRSNTQLIERMNSIGCRGINLIGSHEINVCLLAQMIIEELQ